MGVYQFSSQNNSCFISMLTRGRIFTRAHLVTRHVARRAVPGSRITVLLLHNIHTSVPHARQTMVSRYNVGEVCLPRLGWAANEQDAPFGILRLFGSFQA